MLLIPGPVTTREEVKLAFYKDYAPWDKDFRNMHGVLKRRLLALAGGDPHQHAVLPLQGCGHFAVEAALRTFIAPQEKIVIPHTGDYAEHMHKLAVDAGIESILLPITNKYSPLDEREIVPFLDKHPDITHVGLVYSETGTGVCHDVVSLADTVSQFGCRVIIDAISSFGALPLDISSISNADAVVLTANKCLEAMPGLSFVIAPIDQLKKYSGNAKSWSFDLHDIYMHSLSKPEGTWRFTPVPQSVAALMVALDLLEEEGGIEVRLKRYIKNRDTLYDGVKSIGLQPYLDKDSQGPIVVNIKSPDSHHWQLQTFVDALKNKGIIISNFFNTESPSFRVGCIGAVNHHHMEHAVRAIEESLNEMSISLHTAR